MGWIDLEGAVNVRDLGGLPTRDGGVTLPGRLLRADNLQNLTPADIALLVGGIGLSTVVDLRGSAERASEGPAPLDAVAAVRHAHHPLLPEQRSAAEALATRGSPRPPDYEGDPACGRYLGWLEARPDQAAAALRSVARAEGAALVHCAAGKDRTGVVAALALSAVGVRPEAVIADYAASAERLEAILERLRRSATYASDVNGAPPEAHRPRPQTMAEFLEQLEARHGGAASWLAGQGLGADDLSLLRIKLLGP